MIQFRSSLLVLLAFLFTVPTAPMFAQAVPIAASAARPATETDKLDINTASPAQIKALKGIGDAYTKRIIDGRPYTAKNQLATRGILPQASYDSIKDLIIARAPKK